MAQGCLKQVADSDGGQIRLRLASLEANEVRLLQLEFRCVFDEKHAFFVKNELPECVQEDRFAAAGSTAEQDHLAALDITAQPGCKLRIQSPHSHEVFNREMATVEFADGQSDAMNAARRNDCSDMAGVRGTVGPDS